ncbi:MAG: hypothetical protein WCX88_04675 [Patescibacteria group bacterium]
MGTRVGSALGISPGEAKDRLGKLPKPLNITNPVQSATVIGDALSSDDPKSATAGLPPPPPLSQPDTGTTGGGGGYVTVGTDTWKPQTRITEGIALPEYQIGTEVKPVAVNPRDVKDDEIVIDYRWQTTGANFPPANEINPTGRPAAEVLSEMSSENGYIDPNGFVWKLTSDEDGKPQYMKGAPVVNREVPIMGTAAEKAIMVGQEGLSASEANINAQRDLELAKIQSNQNQVDKRRAVEDEILKREEKRNTNLTIANAHFSQLVSDLENEKVNPSRQFQKLTPAGRMARVVYLFTAGMRGPEFLKLAMDQLNTDVERDIDAQKQAINAKKDRVNGQLQIIKNMRDQFDTERDADNAYFAVRLRQLGDDMETEIAGIKNAAIRAQAEETLATIRTAQADKEYQIQSAVAPTVKEAEDFDSKKTVGTGGGGKKKDDPMTSKDSESRTGYEVLSNAAQLRTIANELANAQKDPLSYVPGTPAFNRRVALTKRAVPLLQNGKSEGDQKLAESRAGAFRDPERTRAHLNAEADAMESKAYTDRGLPPPNRRSGPPQ